MNRGNFTSNEEVLRPYEACLFEVCRIEVVFPSNEEGLRPFEVGPIEVNLVEVISQSKEAKKKFYFCGDRERQESVIAFLGKLSCRATDQEAIL